VLKFIPESHESTALPAAVPQLINFLYIKRIIALNYGEANTGRVPRSLAIVGVVADIRHSGLDHDVSLQMYRPYNQSSTPVAARMSVLLRSRMDPAALATAVRREVSNFTGASRFSM
jgi:hypothetical protein